jgi:LAS superfamily LD-carboxypeptidase LdcB
MEKYTRGGVLHKSALFLSPILYYDTLGTVMKWMMWLLGVILALYTPLLSRAGTLYYVLPEGRPYEAVDLEAVYDQGVELRFGDEVEYLWSQETSGMIWYRCHHRNHFFYLPDTVVVGDQPPIPRDDRGNIPIGRAPVDRDHPLPLDYRPSDLVPLHSGYRAQGYEWREMLLRMEAAKVFERLIDHAEREGVNIRVISAFRDAEYQARLYANAIRRNGNFQNSVAKPGYSEHQLGTAVDLTSDEIGGGLSARFENTAAFQWLKHHRVRYGISLSYPTYKVEVTGYIYEPWHYRYLGKNLWQRQEYSSFTFYAR